MLKKISKEEMLDLLKIDAIVYVKKRKVKGSKSEWIYKEVDVIELDKIDKYEYFAEIEDDTTKLSYKDFFVSN